MESLLLKLGWAVAMCTAALAVSPAHAQAHCAPRDAVIERLKSKYGESLSAGGLQSAVQMIEVWTAPETGSWTILMTRADGKTCILATGTNWHQQSPVHASSGIPG